VLGLGLPTLNFHILVGWRRLTPVGTGVSPEQGATSTKKNPVSERGTTPYLGRCRA